MPRGFSNGYIEATMMHVCLLTPALSRECPSSAKNPLFSRTMPMAQVARFVTDLYYNRRVKRTYFASSTAYIRVSGNNNEKMQSLRMRYS